MDRGRYSHIYLNFSCLEERFTEELGNKEKLVSMFLGGDIIALDSGLMGQRWNPYFLATSTLSRAWSMFSLV